MSEQPEPSAPAIPAAILSDDELRKVRELFAACTDDSFRLGGLLLDSLGASAADMASIFDHTLLRRVAQCWNTGIWERAYDILKHCGRHRQLSALIVLSYVGQPSRRRNDESNTVRHWMREKWRPHDLKDLLMRHDMSEWSGCVGFDQDECPWAELGFVKKLDDELCNAIAGAAVTVHLDGITCVAPEQAQILAQHDGWLYLNGLTEVSDAVADALSGHRSHVFLEGLTTLTHVGLAEKLAKKPVVYLDALVSVSPAAATALVQSGAQVFARSLEQPLPVVAAQ